MTRLFITAKQSVARAIGAALAGKARELEKREDHFCIARADGQLDWVTWCGGHLLALAPPPFYDARYQKWRLEDLPVIPESWKLVEVDAQKYPGLARQLAFIRRSLPQVAVVVHAGDPDREGQWLIDEVLSQSDYSGPVQRLLLTSLNWRMLRTTIKAFEENPPDNQRFKSLSISAQTRSRIDWLYGMNMTRAYTLLGRHAGHEDILSVGRAQTPLLGLVVKRDEVIEGFVPGNRYSLEAKFRKSEEYCHAILRSDQKQSQEKEGLERLAKSLRGMPARLERKEKQHHFQPPPLLLDLATLQMEAAKLFGYSGVEVIKIARRLYEEFHLISYPLTNCRYAPEKYRDEAELILETVAENIFIYDKNIKSLLQNANAWRKSSAWDNLKTTENHAILPTEHKFDVIKMDEKEQNLYKLIVLYYMAQFFPDAETIEEELCFYMDAYWFDASKFYCIEKGWRLLFPDENVVKTGAHVFPDWTPQDKLICESLDVKHHKILPPPRFTEESLISATKNIASFIEDKTILGVLPSFAGIGTEATRAHMIDGLFKRGYLLKGNKSIYSSGIGRDLIRALPAGSVSVEEAVMLEQELSRIEALPVEDAEKAAEELMSKVEQKIRDFVLEAQQKKNIAVHSPEEILGIDHPAKPHCPRCQSILLQKNGRYGAFWGCSAYPACEYTTRRID